MNPIRKCRNSSRVLNQFVVRNMPFTYLMANNLLWGGNAGIVRGVFGEVIIQGKRFSNRWLGPSPGGSASATNNLMDFMNSSLSIY